MKLPWQHDDESSVAEASTHTSDERHAPAADVPKGYTPKKGRPTPKRNEVERARGYRHDEIRPALTPKEAREQRKALKESMSAEEWKTYKAKQKEERNRAQRQARAAMDRGDERYLLARDKGPAKAVIRDWVDSRRFFTSLMMPFAIVLLVFMVIGNRFPTASVYVSMVGMVGMLMFIGEGIWLGRGAAKAARQAHPETTESGWQLGMYAFSRASQPRRLRTPKPKVGPGGPVTR